MKKKTILMIASVILLAAAAWLFFYTTENGVGLTNDSAAYIGGARSILAGKGYSRLSGDKLPRPITQFPPLYSLAISGVSRISGKDALDAAKWVNLVCYLVGLILWIRLLIRISRRWVPVVLGGIAFLCCPPILKAFVYGLSEALYLPLFLGILNLSYAALGVSAERTKEKRPLLWLAAGILCGLLLLTRYAAFAVIAALAVSALCLPPKWKERFQALLLCLAGFALPALPWLWRNRSVDTGGAVNRTLSFHFPAADKLEEGIMTVAGFFFPEYGGLIENHLKIWGIGLLAALAVLFLAAAVLCVKGFFLEKIRNVRLFLPILHAAAYLAMLFLDAMYVDGSTVFDDRMLLPFFLLALLFIYSLGSCWMENRGKALRVAAVCLMAGFPLLLLEDETDLITDYHKNGQGFAGSQWMESETRLAALELDREKTFFSNRQTLLWLINDEPSYIIPPMFNAANFEERQSFFAERDWMREEVLLGNAYAIVFNYQELMADEGDREWLDAVLEDLPMLGEYSDGAIFGL